MAHPLRTGVHGRADGTPAEVNHVGATGPAAPRTPAEEVVLGIFRDVLGRDDIGVLDDFFDLGGSSLRAIKALGRIHESSGVRVRAMDFFESPTVAALAGVVSAAAPAERPMVSRRPADAEPVLSYDQQRLWLEDQLLPGAAYHVHGRQRLVGDLDVAALDGSLRVIVDRHEALRSRFPVRDGRTVQIVDDLPDDWHIRFEDLSDHPRGEDAARELMDDDAAAPFDLERGPLVRCLLIRTGATEHLLSITAHHIVCDDWSVGVFARELSALYAAGGDPDRADLPVLEIQYRDFAVWQRRWLTGESLARQVDYWRGHLAGAPPALALPSRRRSAPSEVPVGGRVRAVLPAADTRALDELCRRADATPFMALLAALGTVLGRWSGQQDVVIGVPITGRTDARMQTLIGFFVNTVPVRLDLSGNPTFAELLARARTAAVGGYAHADAPLDLLVGEIPATRVPARTPLFQVILNGVDTPEIHPLVGVSSEVLDTPTRPSKFELTLTTREWDGVLQFDLEFNASRHEQAMIEHLLEQMTALLRAAALDPDRRVLDHPLHPAGRRELAAGPGDRASDDGRLRGSPVGNRPVASPGAADVGPPAERFAVDTERFAVDADRVAVVDRDGEWTYGRLDVAADPVARALLRHVPPDARDRGSADPDGPRIGIVWRPVAACVAAVLGCARAGVPFSLIDPGDARGVTGVLDVRSDGAAITLDVHAEGATVVIDLCAPPTDEENAVAPDAPGGVDWAVERYGFGPDDRFAVLSGSPDHVVSALSTAFAAGATLVLVDHSFADDPEALAAELDAAAVTVMYVTPPILRALAERPLRALRHVFVDNSGQFVSPDVAVLRRLAPDARCTGLYRVGRDGRPAAVHDVPADWTVETAPLRVPLGSAVRDTVRLVHPGGQYAAVGEVAEIHVGADRTADVGRRWADGMLELVGTAGVDTDAVQTTCALRELPGVVDALVTESPAVEGGIGLVAYVATAGATFDTAAAQPQLAVRLPDALVPRHLVVLDRLPLTAAGEYDLAALPPPGTAAPADRYVAPRTPLERRLVEILAALLGVDRVGVHDSFFELGGFSLLATQLNIRIRETVDVDLSLRDIFESSTVEVLAQRIAYRQAEQERTEDVEALLDELESMGPGRP